MTNQVWTVARAEIPESEAELFDRLASEEENWPWLVALRQDPPRTGEIIGYFANGEAAHEAIADLRRIGEREGIDLPDHWFQFHQEGESDWAAAYRAHFKPWAMGGIHWVPVWERDSYQVPEGDRVIWLDPGMAFGTGNHETTRLCLQELSRLRDELCAANQWEEGWDCVDAGCGTGILALSAEALGYGPVWGFDNDPVAVKVARENATLQGSPEPKVVWREGDLLTGWPDHSGGVVVANILAVVLIQFVNPVVAAVRPGGYLILSGILAREVDDVRSAYAGKMNFLRFSTMGEWAVLVLQKP